MTKKILRVKASHLKGMGVVFLSRHCINRCIERVFLDDRRTCNVKLRQVARNWLSKGIKKGKPAKWYRTKGAVVYCTGHERAVVVGEFIILVSQSSNGHWNAKTMIASEGFGV